MLGIEYVKDRHIATLLVILVLLGLAAYIYGIHFGNSQNALHALRISLSRASIPKKTISVLRGPRP